LNYYIRAVLIGFLMTISAQCHNVNAYPADMPNALILNEWKFHFSGTDSSFGYAATPDISSFKDVKLPHTFPRTSENSPPPQGVGWYICDIEIPQILSKDVFIDFGGVCLRAKVFVDGVLAGESSLAYLPFRVDITSFLHGKTRVRIAVCVDNRLLPQQIPDRNARGWWLYGGLIREVCLKLESRHRIDKAEIRTFYRATDTFDLQIKLAPAQLPWDSVSVSIKDTGMHTLFHSSMTGIDTVLRTGPVHSWTPDSPYQYKITLVPFSMGVPGDTLRLRRGFCQLTAQKSRLYLNNKPYFLRGIGRHDVLDDKGPLLLREDRLKDLLDLKQLGVNFLRIAHFPQHGDIYDLCDSLGILVMDEIPAWKTASDFLSSPSGKRFGIDYADAMVEAHGNHTCVCLWSIGNQFGSFRKSVAEFVKSVSHEIKKNDMSRLVTFCSFYYIWDKAFSYVDIISINEYFGWELASLDMLGGMLDDIHKDWPDKPVMVSELGAQSKPGLRNSTPKLAGAIKSMLTKDISEDHQALYIRSHIDTIWTRRAYVDGMIVWSYSDYMTYMNKSRTPDMPKGLNCCGIVTCERKKKLSYFVVQDRYNYLKEQWKIEQDSAEPSHKRFK
jgi:hypothetical protein